MPSTSSPSARLDGDIVYDFSHPLLQETLYAELGLARTRALHGAIAESLERLYGARAMRHAGKLAFHYARGDRRRLAIKAVEYPPRRRPRRIGEVRQSRGGGRLERRPRDRRSGAWRRQRRRLAGDRARDRERAGARSPAPRRLSRLRSSCGIAPSRRRRARRSGLALARLQRSIGLARYWTGAFDAALEHFDAALAAAHRAGDGLLEARVLIARASAAQAAGRSRRRARRYRARARDRACS